MLGGVEAPRGDREGREGQLTRCEIEDVAVISFGEDHSCGMKATHVYHADAVRIRRGVHTWIPWIDPYLRSREHVSRLRVKLRSRFRSLPWSSRCATPLCFWVPNIPFSHECSGASTFFLFPLRLVSFLICHRCQEPMDKPWYQTQVPNCPLKITGICGIHNLVS